MYKYGEGYFCTKDPLYEGSYHYEDNVLTLFDCHYSISGHFNLLGGMLHKYFGVNTFHILEMNHEQIEIYRWSKKEKTQRLQCISILSAQFIDHIFALNKGNSQ